MPADQLLTGPDLHGRVAVVTGGDPDLGRVISLRLSLTGADVVVLGRTMSALEDTAHEIEAIGRRAWAFPCDLTDEADVVRTFAQVVAAVDRVDVLVNNATAPRYQAPVAEMDLGAWQSAFAVKVTGAMLRCRRGAARDDASSGMTERAESRPTPTNGVI